VYDRKSKAVFKKGDRAFLFKPAAKSGKAYKFVDLSMVLTKSYPKNISAVKKARTRKRKLLNDLKMSYHSEAKKKSYTS